MRISVCRVLAVMALSYSAFPAVGQVGASQPESSCVPDSSPMLAYAADFRFTSVNLLADGSTKTYYYYGTEMADSQRRTIVSTTMPSASGKGMDITGARIFDPVNGTETIWNSDWGHANVWTMPPVEDRHGCWQLENSRFRLDFDKLLPQRCAERAAVTDVATQNDDTDQAINSNPDENSHDDAASVKDDVVPQAQPSKPVYETLGIAMIAGVRAYGMRWTWPVDANPTGDKNRNDARPWTMAEHWVATERRDLWVRQVVNYPAKPNRTLQWTKELASFKRGEPDLNAYEPPPNLPAVKKEMHRVPCGQREPPAQ